MDSVFYTDLLNIYQTDKIKVSPSGSGILYHLTSEQNLENLTNKQVFLTINDLFTDNHFDQVNIFKIDINQTNFQEIWTTLTVLEKTILLSIDLDHCSDESYNFLQQKDLYSYIKVVLVIKPSTKIVQLDRLTTLYNLYRTCYVSLDSNYDQLMKIYKSLGIDKFAVSNLEIEQYQSILKSYHTIATNYPLIQLPKGKTKKRIALCFHGMAGGKNSRGIEVNIGLGFETYKEFINSDLYDVDVFFHTWENKNQSLLLNKYHPKKYLVEKQIRFVLNTPDITGCQQRHNPYCLIQRIYSNWYSSYRVNEMRNKYEQENNIQYDLIFLSRFDVKLKINHNQLSELNPDKFYVLNPSPKPDPKMLNNTILLDYLFISGRQPMDIVCDLYFKIEDYIYLFHFIEKNDFGTTFANILPSYHLKKINKFDLIAQVSLDTVYWTSGDVITT